MKKVLLVVFMFALIAPAFVSCTPVAQAELENNEQNIDKEEITDDDI